MFVCRNWYLLLYDLNLSVQDSVQEVFRSGKCVFRLARRSFCGNQCLCNALINYFLSRSAFLLDASPSTLPTMRFISIALATILLAGTSTNARSDSNLLRGSPGGDSSNSNNGRDPNVVDNGTPNGITLTEYETLMGHRDAIVNFWTSDRIRSAKPVQMTVNDFFGFEFAKENSTITGNNGTATSPPGGRNRSLQVADSEWTQGGDIYEATGRLLFSRGTSNYLCSATAITDPEGLGNGRSIILTAAHCVFDSERTDIEGVSALFFMYLISTVKNYITACSLPSLAYLC